MLRDAYLTIDRRLLGVFRIYFGALLLADLGYHGAQATLFYSNSGVLSNHRGLYAPMSAYHFSVLDAFSTPGEVKLAFGSIAIVYALYLVGWKTRWMQVLALIGVTSIDARNLFAEDGGCVTMNLLAAWTLLLPLGDRFSIDALMKRTTTRARGEIEPTPDANEHKVSSLAVTGILLQAATIYFFNAIHKNGWSWSEGDAIHQVLWQNRCNTPLAGWLRFHEPSWVSPVLTKLTLLIEINLPVLILMPIARRVCRSAAFALAVLLHGSIATVMTLGMFSYVMIALMMLVIPHEVVDAIASRVATRPIAQRIDRAIDRLVDRWVQIDQRGLIERSGVERAPAIVALSSALREVWIAIFMIACGYQVLRSNAAVPLWMRPPTIAMFDAMTMYPRLSQGWRMFAPETPVLDGIVIIDGVTVDGRHLDPFTGKAPDFEILDHGPYAYPILVADYLFVLGSEQNAWARDELAQYVLSWQRTTHRPAADRIVRFDAYLMLNDAPPRGETRIRNLRKEVLFSGE